jgi:Fe-S oxidoreductase
LVLRLVVGLGMTAAVLPIAGHRLWWLYRLATSGQPAPERLQQVRQRLAEAVRAQLAEVFGQRKLLKWTLPGVAHFLVFWAFVILGSVYVEAYGALFDPDFHIPLIGRWPVLGFAQDLIALAALVGIVTFAVIRLVEAPRRLGRRSRFSGSHLGGAWLILFMIFNVIWTLFLFRGSSVNSGHFPYASGAFASQAAARVLAPLGERTNEVLETVGVLLHIAVMLSFLIVVVYSKHLHIFLAPLNVLFARRPDGLGAALPMMSGGQPLDFEEADPDTDVFGRGKVEDFTWKGFLDFGTCTECGRCQSQCPAWNTGKPLSPKMVILDLRDHALAKAPYLLAASEEERADLPEDVLAEVNRPLVAEDGVIHPDVLWSCTTCGACVEQCPVDIEHVDHILDMRRYQVLIESAFPSEAGTMLRNLENKGNPWGLNAAARLDWTQGLDFEVKVVGDQVEDLSEVEYLFWVGCAGAFEESAKKTSRAVAELLHTAGVEFAVLGPGESCTGDPARRLGNEFVFQMLAQANVAVLGEAKATKIVATCPHCFNTLANEYPQVGGVYEVVHHTQLLSRLVAEGRLTPVTPVDARVTYHDPCYLGRHNKVYTPPRELLARVDGLRSTEMHRCRERGFCCGAGGARMWMEERIGKRINEERVDEALSLDPDIVSTACPFCLVMLGDSIKGKQQTGEAREDLRVVDVSQLLVEAVRTRSAAGAPPSAAGAEVDRGASPAS